MKKLHPALRLLPLLLLILALSISSISTVPSRQSSLEGLLPKRCRSPNTSADHNPSERRGD